MAKDFKHQVCMAEKAALAVLGFDDRLAEYTSRSSFGSRHPTTFIATGKTRQRQESARDAVEISVGLPVFLAGRFAGTPIAVEGKWIVICGDRELGREMAATRVSHQRLNQCPKQVVLLCYGPGIHERHD
jgi:hypothetical protein